MGMLLDRVIKYYFAGTESDMRYQHHSHHTRMALLNATGEPFLIWLDVCSRKSVTPGAMTLCCPDSSRGEE